MKLVFSVLHGVDIDDRVFTLLKQTNDRKYYIATDLFKSLVRDAGHTKARDIEIALEEFHSAANDLDAMLGLWCGVSETSVINLTVDEVELFLELFEQRASEQLFVNLGVPEEDTGVSIGEVIFVNSLVDIIYRGRESNGQK